MKKIVIVLIPLLLIFFILIRLFSTNNNESGYEMITGWEYSMTSVEVKSAAEIEKFNLNCKKSDNTKTSLKNQNTYMVFRKKIETTGLNDMFLVMDDVISSMRIYSGDRLIYSYGEMSRKKYHYIGSRTHFVDVSNISEEYVYIVLYSPGFIIGLNKAVYLVHKFDISIGLIKKGLPVITLTPVLVIIGFIFLILNMYGPSRSSRFYSLGFFLVNLGFFSVLDFCNKGILLKNIEMVTNFKNLTLFLIPITLHFFIQKNFNLKFTRICRVIIIIQTVFILSALSLVNSGILVYNDTFYVYIILLLFSIVVISYRIMFVAKISDIDSKILITGLIVLLAFSIHDILITVYHVCDTDEKLVLGTFTFALSLVAITLRQIVAMMGELKAANAELENYSINLEKDVLDRTEELSNSRNEIEMLFRDLQYSKLIQDNDLELAKNIQSNFLLEKVPQCTDWDIAFRYIPVFDVSGDIYDFYTGENGELSGLALYDVSGHGVSSGLITMVTKLISFQKFRELKKSPLQKVVTAINETLAVELDKVENYLTGIVMRLHSDSIEYCNCAHPDVLIKKNSTGIVSVAVDDPKKHKNFILGSEIELDVKPPVVYPVEKGDIILLYTDSMYEEKNSSNEFFGVDRLMQAFQDCAHNEPELLLDELVSRVRNFSYNDKFHDDCTVICLRKK